LGVKFFNAKEKIEGKYIISFKKGINAQSTVDYFTYTTQSNIPVRPFEIGEFRGVFATLTARQLEEHLAFDNILDYVEEDGKVYASCKTQEKPASWGLDRLSERALDLAEDRFNYVDSAGSGVSVYIVDTGIRTTHKEFGGRASWGTNEVDNTDTDCNGHGTHVAGTVGGTTHGVAKAAKVIAVKVLDCDGSGSYSGVIAGIQWVVRTATKPAVANMSLGGGKSTSVNSAVAAAVDAGIPFVVAAGNDNSDASLYSPASEPKAITVGSTDIGVSGQNSADIRSYFSNYGKLVDVFAPGSVITSAWYTSDTATNRISGTSMAAPHVAGAVALILGENKAFTPAQVVATIINDANNDLIDLLCTSTVCSQTENRLLYHAC